MPSWRDGLSGAALQIAEAPDRVLRVAAGPGTGKSFTMKRRLARLIVDAGIAANRILAVTFTRTAAADLVASIRALEVAGSENIRAGTLHSFCFGLLSRDAVFTVLRRTPRPLVTFKTTGVLRFEAEPMLADIRDDAFGGMQEKTTRILAFEAAWARLQSEDPGWPNDPTDRRFQGAVVNWLQFHRTMLIGELIPLTLRYLRQNPMAEELSAYDVVVVDEYQDLNRAEQVLIDTLAGNNQLMVIGDEDQSIYSFRHANPDGIVQFVASHANALDQPLAECRRCPKRVVAMADSLIRHNHTGVAAPRLNPKPDNPEGEVAIVQWQTADDEIAGLTKYVQLLIQQRGVSPGDVLILTPRRTIGYGIRDGLVSGGIAAHSFYSEEALEPAEAQSALVLLRLLTQRNDRCALRWWLGAESPSWRAGEYARIRDIAERENIEPFVVLEQIINGQRSVPRTTECAARFQDLTSQLQQLEGKTPAEVVDDLLAADADWAKAMRDSALSQLAVEPATTLAGIVEAVVTSITQPEMPEEGEFVRVMSLHKSKGLTAKIVLVTSCNEGLIPTIVQNRVSRREQDQIQEGRRLFYVCCTRCTETLILSSFAQVADTLAHSLGLAQGPRRGRRINVQASRFLDELGPRAPTPIRGNEWLQAMEQAR